MRKEILLPAVAVAGGGAGFVLRRWELATAFEADTGLPIPGAPATLALIALSVAMAAVLALLCRGKYPSFTGYDEAFQAKGNTLYATAMVLSAFLLLGAAVLMVLSFVQGTNTVYTRLLLAALAAVSFFCVMQTAQNSFKGLDRGKYSFTLLMPAYTCCVWLIAAYQVRAGDPVQLDYVYELFAIIASLLGLYFHAGFSFERGRVFWAGLFSLLGIYFCLTTLADQHDLATTLLYGFAILYLLSSTVTLLYNAGRRSSWPGPKTIRRRERPMNPEKFYITTPIYYPSDKLHIGHTYCTVATDAMARYKRLRGCEVMFLTGTDEHGQKIEDKAKEAGVSPKEFVDHIVEGPRGVLDLWKLMNISNDRFIRTTDDYHVESVQKIFKQLYEQGDIYKGKYVGKYCKPCESFWTETQLKDGKCPDCGRDVVDAEEEAYFFRLSKYADRIRHLLEDTDFLEPRSRVNEMVNNFIKPGLEDLCVSRTSFSWGVPVDFDPGHVVYVWIDALSNYINALGYGNDRYHDFEKFWPADVHFVGKEIVRFHSIIWPAILMALGLPLPKKVYGHGWLLLDGGKMSKSKGNVVDPYLLAERYGVDALRYFLLREFPFGTDGNFSNEALIGRINTDLANDLGNLVSRTTAMVGKYFGERLPEDCGATGDEAELAGMLAQAQGEVNLSMDFPEDDPRKYDVELIALAAGLRGRYEAQMEHYAFQDALVEVFKLIGRANKYIDENKPWALAKDEAQKPRLAHVLYNLLECVRLSAVLLTPFMPETCGKIFAQLGVDEGARTWESAGAWGLLPAGAAVSKGENLFPRIDVEKELAALDELQAEARRAALPAVEVEPFAQESVDFDTFCKSDFRAVKVKACESVKKSAKLLRFILDDGSGTDRQILSGIAMYYKPEELVGKTLVAIINLPPRKMMGQESCGMLLSAVHTEHGEEKLHLVMVDDAIPAGAKLC